MQSKKYSFAESLVNVFLGLLVSFLIQLAIYPALGIPVRLDQNIVITAVFTIASIIRSYLVRRVFNTFKK